MPSTALKTVRPISTSVVLISCVKTWLTTAAPSRTICMKSLYWRTNACQPDSFFFAASSLGPYFAGARLHLGGAQPLGRVDLEPASHLVDRGGVPRHVALRWLRQRRRHVVQGSYPRRGEVRAWLERAGPAHRRDGRGDRPGRSSTAASAGVLGRVVDVGDRLVEPRDRRVEVGRGVLAAPCAASWSCSPRSSRSLRTSAACSSSGSASSAAWLTPATASARASAFCWVSSGSLT